MKKDIKEEIFNKEGYDEEAIKKDEMFDGYYGIETSEKNLTAKEILKAGLPGE